MKRWLAALIACVALLAHGAPVKIIFDTDMYTDFDDAALAVLAKDGYDPAYGARPVKRAIQRELETPVARAIIAGKYPPQSTVKVSASAGVLTLA